MDADSEWEVVESKDNLPCLADSDVSYFQKTFQLDEKPVFSEFCSVDSTQGWVYISKKHFCFISLLRRGIIKVAFSDILEVKLEPWKIGPKSLGKSAVLCLDNNKTVAVYSPFGAKMYGLLKSLWKISREQDVTLAEGHAQSEVVDLMMRTQGSVAPSSSILDDPKKQKATAALRKALHSESFELVDYSDRVIFVFERQEHLGCFYVSPCFAFVSKAMDIVVTGHVLQLSWIDYAPDGVSLKLQFSGGDLYFEFRAAEGSSLDRQVELLRAILRTERARVTSDGVQQVVPSSHCAVLFSKELLDDRNEFDASYPSWSDERRSEWVVYAEQFGRGSLGRTASQVPISLSNAATKPAIIRKTPEWDNLVRDGIPDDFRGHVWALSCGAFYETISRPQYFKQMLLEQKRQGDRSFAALRDISKDIGRTLPSHPFFQSDDGLEALQRVLMAYAFHNPKVGYTQSMNFLCALFLLYMSEEMAFWMMAAVCERIAPHVYRKSMVGMQAQLATLEVMLQTICPKVSKHLAEQDFNISMVATGWMMCMYISFLPWEICLRIFDRCMCSSATYLYRVSVAIFIINENALLDCQNLESILHVLQRFSYKVEEIMTVADNTYQTFSDAQIEDLEQQETTKAIRRVARDVEASLIQGVHTKTKFNVADVKKLYGTFKELLDPNNPVGAMELKQFCVGLGEAIPAWKNRNQVLMLAFKQADTDCNGLVQFEEYATCLSTLLHGSPEEQLRYCLNLYEYTGRISSEGVCAAIEDFAALYQHTNVKSDVERLCKQVNFDASIEGVCKQLIDLGVTEAYGIGQVLESDLGDFEVV